MENSIIVQCPCCGMGLEIINNGFLGSRASIANQQEYQSKYYVCCAIYATMQYKGQV